MGGKGPNRGKQISSVLVLQKNSIDERDVAGSEQRGQGFSNRRLAEESLSLDISHNLKEDLSTPLSGTEMIFIRKGRQPARARQCSGCR